MSSKEMMVVSPQPEAIVPKHLAVTNEQMELARKTIADKLTPQEFELFLYNCRRQGVHPLDNLLIPVPRTDNGVRKLSFTTTVDLLRSRAAETNDYAGNDDAVFEPGTPFPTSATMTVWRIVQGVRCPFTATARWSEYYPGDKQGFMWKTKPHIMLAKCAEALALRKAFPKQLAGMYAMEEVERIDTRPQRRTVVHGTLPANVSALSPSVEPNRGHEDTGLQRTPEQSSPREKTMCAECRVVDGHDKTCSQFGKLEQDRRTSSETVKAAYMIMDFEAKTKKKNNEPYLLLSVVAPDPNGGADKHGKLYVWHQSCHEYLKAGKGKTLLCEVSTKKEGDKDFVSLEHILEIGGVPFVNNAPAQQGELKADDDF